MTKTAIAKLIVREFKINQQEAFRLVNNCIRDRILVEVDYHEKGTRRSKKYIVLRTMDDIQNEKDEERQRMNEEYGLTDEDWEIPLDDWWS